MVAFNVWEFLSGIFLGEIGEATWLFLPAVIIRVIILYIYAFILLRLMGKRENKQVTMFDAVVIVILGDLIGTPTIDFQLPLVLAMLALGVFLAIERAFIFMVQHSKRLEKIIESDPALLLEDGKINFETLRKEKLGIDEFYSSLRLKGVCNLGQVQRAYLENSGEVSVFKKDEPKEGLTILPENQGSPPHYGVNSQVMFTDQYFCWNCGNKTRFNEGSKFSPCPTCQGKEWVSPDRNHE